MSLPDLNAFSFKDGERSKISKGELKIEPPVEYEKQKMILFKFVLWFTGLWSILVAFLLTARAFNLWGCFLPVPVICTLLTTTMATVIGLPLIVSKHFFPKKQE